MAPRKLSDANHALDLLRTLTVTAHKARAAGWEVHIAVETGAELDRLTFSASRAVAAAGAA